MTDFGRKNDEDLPETVADSVLAAPLVRYAAKSPGQYVSAKNEPAFVLTTWPWRETSLIVSLLPVDTGVLRLWLAEPNDRPDAFAV